jgi:lycopene cyclase domain-containing protein
VTYVWLSLIFLGVAAVMLGVALVSWRSSRQTLVARWRLPIAAAGVVVVILTAVFDNVMIHSGLIAYASETISGMLIGVAPLEDFAYPVAGLILLPSLWLLFGKRGTNDR